MMPRPCLSRQGPKDLPRGETPHHAGYLCAHCQPPVAYYERGKAVHDHARCGERISKGAVTPTPSTAFHREQDPLQMYLSDSYTVIANLAGIPALTLPCGKTTGASHWHSADGRPFQGCSVLGRRMLEIPEGGG